MLYEPAMAGASISSAPNMPLPVPAIAYAPAPVSGVLRVLIIAAEFPDVPHTVSIDTIRSEWVDQVAKYYQEDSFGRDASTLARHNVTFANYDYYVFIHSGDGQESSGNTNDVWSVTYLAGVWVNPCLQVQEDCTQKTLTKFNIDPELEAGGAVPIGVYCHEFAHNLDLPDLYNTNTGKTILGPWSLMDKGLWNGAPKGSSPSHMDAWSKMQLGFLSGSLVLTANPGATTTYTIETTEVASSTVHAVLVPIGSNVTSPMQYYIIEVRSAIGFDAALPSVGVLLLYVDTALSTGRVRIINANPNKVDLSEAPWTMGQTFTDSKNGWSMTVVGHTGSSYQVTVNRGGTLQPPIQPPPIQNQTFVDLAVTSISAEPRVITVPNTTVTITVQISNSGTEAADNVPLQVNLDARLYTNLQISVNANATTPATFTWVSTLGTHTFEITIDPNNTLNNTNRGNNSATFTVSVGPALAINVPLIVTVSGIVRIGINGAKYSVTSTSRPTFQTEQNNGGDATGH